MDVAVYQRQFVSVGLLVDGPEQPPLDGPRLQRAGYTWTTSTSILNLRTLW